MALKNKIRRYMHKMRITALATAIAGVSVLGGMMPKDSSKQAKTLKTEQTLKDSAVKASLPQVKNPVLEIAYHTDTLEKASSTLLMYLNGTITRYYLENNNSYRMQMPYFAHEEWHHHNDESGYRKKYYLSPLEYYKLCMHDEISANMAALLTARYEYLAAPNKAERQKIIAFYKNTYLKFYFEAVEAGKIKPTSGKKKDIEAERKFIANGTRDMWMQKYSNHYSPMTYRMLQRYVDRLGLVEDSKKNYQHLLKHMYTIGGVNFAQYFDEDIYPKDDKVRLAEQLRTVKSLRAGGLEFMNNVNNSYSLMQEVGIGNTVEAYQHLLISSQLKYMLRHKTAEELAQNPQLINLSFIKIMNDVHRDKSFSKAVMNYPLVAADRFNLKASKADYDGVLRKMYTFNGVDLSTMVTDFEHTALPVRSRFDNFVYDNFQPFYMSPMALAYLDKAAKAGAGETIRFPFKLSRTKSEEKAEEQDEPQRKKARSGPLQYLRIPNLREPLLTAATKEDYSQVLDCMRDFASYPQVLKECNTPAQEKYLQQHKESRDSLLLLRPKGTKSSSER